MLGYEVLQSYSSQQALERLKTESVDLVLSDYKMPSMTGLELVAQMRKEGCFIPVVLMSGHAAVIDRIRAKQLGILIVLEKPFDLATIQEALEMALK